jgi:hypothetical protein
MTPAVRAGQPQPRARDDRCASFEGDNLGEDGNVPLVDGEVLDDSRPDAAEGPQDGDEDGQLKQRAQVPAGAESVRGDLTRFSNLRN